MSDREKFTSLLAELHNNNIDIFFRLDSSIYDNNEIPYKYIPNIDPRAHLNDVGGYMISSSLTNIENFNKESFGDSESLKKEYKIIEIYKEYIRKVLQTLYNSNENQNKIDAIIESVIQVEAIFSRGFTEYFNNFEYNSSEPTYYNDDNFEYNSSEPTYYDDDYENYDYSFEESPFEIVTNIKSFDEKYPLIDWKLYLEKRFKFYDIEIPINDELLIKEFIEFEPLYKCLTEIENEDLINYIEWGIIESILNMSYSNKNLISKELYGIRKEFEKSLNDIEMNFEEEEDTTIEEESNEEEYEDGYFKGNDAKTKCLNIIDSYMYIPLSKYYVEKNFPENIKSITKDMAENIRNALINRIKKLEWLDESTREYAIKKVLNIKYSLVYSDYIMNIDNYYNRYKNLGNVQNNYLLTLIYLYGTYDYKNFYKIYNENVDESSDPIESNKTYILNAFYREDNSIDIPAAVLQPPIFDENQPDYINYGKIGYTMGHELNHSIDDKFKDYDIEGNYNNWWTENDNEEFIEYSKCFIDQYSNYYVEIEGKKYYIDSMHTLGENLADNGGFDRSYEAWKISMETNPESAEERNKRLPGLSEYTIDQLFYISYAQYYCTVGINEEFIYDEHSFGRFRVNGVLSNNKHFSKIFNCPVNSPMNPEQKCSLY